MFATAKNEPRCLPDLESKLRRNDAVRAAANAVGTEIFAHHSVLTPCNSVFSFDEEND
jgi:hypothetical protein